VIIPLQVRTGTLNSWGGENWREKRQELGIRKKSITFKRKTIRPCPDIIEKGNGLQSAETAKGQGGERREDDKEVSPRRGRQIPGRKGKRLFAVSQTKKSKIIPLKEVGTEEKGEIPRQEVLLGDFPTKGQPP